MNEQGPMKHEIESKGIRENKKTTQTAGEQQENMSSRLASGSE